MAGQVGSGVRSSRSSQQGVSRSAKRCRLSGLWQPVVDLLSRGGTIRTGQHDCLPQQIPPKPEPKVDEQQPETASIYYEDRRGKPTLAVTGAFGGPTPDARNVVAHLYVEHVMVPSIAELQRTEDGGYQQAREIRRGTVRREIQATLVLSPQVATSLGQWLIGHGQLAAKNSEESSS